MGQIKTLVAALYRLPSGYDEGRSHADMVEQKTLHNPYKLDGLEPGRYNVAAWQDLNGNGEVDNGEPFGVYYDALNKTVDVTVDALSRSIIDIDIDLKPYSASGQSARAAGKKSPLAALAEAAREQTSAR